MQIDIRAQTELATRWTYLEGLKSSHTSNSEEYARWTLPYVFPSQNSENVELQLSKDSIGAQAVNHLANKVVSVLFPPQRMFFRLHVSPAMLNMASKAMQQSGGANVQQAQEAVSKAMVVLEAELATKEKEAQDYMDMVTYRPQAVNAAKLLIITGNALMFHPEGQPVQVFNLRDYCVVRDLSGEIIEIMTKEQKSFETFHPDIQVQLRASKLKPMDTKNGNQYNDKSNVTIYTRIVLEQDGKYHAYQAGDNIMLDTDGASWTKKSLPWIVLTWNLVRGEDYGRGLVADYAGAFHAINVLSGSLLNMAAIMGDIKFLVNPASLVDVPTLNRAGPGTYHSGRADDVTAIQLDKQSDAQFIAALIERYERQIAQAFLLNSQLTRNAERVTAEEIQMQANELETSNGGIYSRLAGTWQVQTANIVLEQIGFEATEQGITPKIITGMDSLSRMGELDNIRLFLGDLAMLNGVPEDVRGIIDLPSFAEVLGTNRQVDYKKFIKTQAQLQAEAQQRQAEQQALMQQDANAKGQVAASTEAMKDS